MNQRAPAVSAQFLLCNSAARDWRKAGHRLEVVEIHGIANVLTRGVAERLEVPGVALALVERGVDKAAPALTLAHTSVQFGEVPTFPNLGAKLGDECGA